MRSVANSGVNSRVAHISYINKAIFVHDSLSARCSSSYTFVINGIKGQFVSQMRLAARVGELNVNIYNPFEVRCIRFMSIQRHKMDRILPQMEELPERAVGSPPNQAISRQFYGNSEIPV